MAIKIAKTTRQANILSSSPPLQLRGHTKKLRKLCICILLIYITYSCTCTTILISDSVYITGINKKEYYRHEKSKVKSIIYRVLELVTSRVVIITRLVCIPLTDTITYYHHHTCTQSVELYCSKSSTCNNRANI